MTIGQTTIKLATILEHSFRRSGITAESQTPENIEIAKNNLFFILTNFANKGMNYWCVDEKFITLTEGQSRIDMPDGTIDVLNTNYRRMTNLTGTDVTASTSIIRQFSAESAVVMFMLSSSFSGTVTIATSDDNVTYTTHSTITHSGGTQWYNLDPSVNTTYFKLSIASGTFTVSELLTSSAYADVPMYRMNRDQYSTLPNKYTKDNPLQFLYDRQVSPAMVLWPAPSLAASSNCIQIYRNHQISDVGSLSAELDIPKRWHEATIWGLSQNLCFELPGVQPERAQLCMQMAEKTLGEVQNEERDNSPIELVPNIGVYNA